MFPKEKAGGFRRIIEKIMRHPRKLTGENPSLPETGYDEDHGR
jgi:hypothetical protein